MNDADRRVVALAAALVPERTPALLARLATADAADAVALGQRLARATRRDRLQALSAALATDPRRDVAVAEALATLERPRLARLLRSLAAGSPDGEEASPVLVRLCRERIEG